jgi:hypothetical protein
LAKFVDLESQNQYGLLFYTLQINKTLGAQFYLTPEIIFDQGNFFWIYSLAS